MDFSAISFQALLADASLVNRQLPIVCAPRLRVLASPCLWSCLVAATLWWEVCAFFQAWYSGGIKVAVELLSNDFVRRLEALALLVRKALCTGAGDTPRKHLKGGSVEFAEHRDYSPGDEWRYIDWNVYARNERLVVREFDKEELLETRILLDASASMALGVPSKFDLARQVAAAVAYVSMNENAAVHLMSRSGTSSRNLSDLRGKACTSMLLGFLRELEAGGATVLSRALGELASLRCRRSSIVVISDLLEDGPVREGLSALVERGHEVAVLHVLGERVRLRAGERCVKLVDSESGEILEVLLDERTMGNYYAELDRFCARWEQFARSHRIGYLNFPSSTACEEVVLACLRSGCVFRLAAQR